MKRFSYLLSSLFVLSVVIGSCTSADSYSYSHVEERIRGEWTIDKVHLENNGKLCETDVTEQYAGMVFNFEESNYLTIYDAAEDKTYPGVWYLDEIYTWDEQDQENDKSFELYTYVYNPEDTTQYRTMTFVDLRVNNNRLFGRYKKYNAGKTRKYSFKFKR